MVRILNAVSILLLLVMFGMVATHYGNLPERVPTHFNVGGDADRWRSRSVVWLLPLIAAHLFVLIRAFSLLKVSFVPGADEPDTREQFRVVLALAQTLILAFMTYLSLLQLRA